MTNPAIIYLHGFISSPLSAKARMMGDYLRAHALPIDYCVPALPEEPARALAAAEQAVFERRAAGAASIGLIGSSMGGFYATVLAQRYGLRAAVVNPAVAPHRHIHRYFGEQTNPYSGRRFALDASDAAELERLEPVSITETGNFWLLAQRGDTVVDCGAAERFYGGCRQTIEAGGDHQFQGFERYLPALVEFLLR